MHLPRRRGHRSLLTDLAHPSERNIRRWLGREIDHVDASLVNRPTVVDIGCGSSPYRSVLEHRGGSYIGVDGSWNDLADMVGTAESIPLADASADVVVCTQVLEHVDDPRQAIAEIYRVVKPGGWVFLSTHGTFIYHPNPQDHWRWTHTGLIQMFLRTGAWDRLTISPEAGTAETLAYLNGYYLSWPLRRLFGDTPADLLLAATRCSGYVIDRLIPRLRRLEGGAFHGNYFVSARRSVTGWALSEEDLGAKALSIREYRIGGS